MTFLTLDIETVPQALYVDPAAYAAGEFVLERDWYDKHHSDELPDAILEGVAPLAATHVAPALHATTCHIVQVSFGWRAPMGNQAAELHRRVLQANQYSEPVVDVAAAERALITEALDIMARACSKRTTIVTFNGKGFDLPILRARALLAGATIPTMPCIPWRRLLYPFDDNQHADLRLILGNDDRRARGTLQWWADCFGVHAEEHGSEVYAWVRAGEWDKLESYGITEAQTLVELYERVVPVI